MNRWIASGVALFTGAIVAGLAAGCAPDTAAPTLAPRLSEGARAETQNIALDLTVATPILEPFTDQACLDCHTDQTQLTTLAVAEEKTEALSSGPG